VSWYCTVLTSQRELHGFPIGDNCMIVVNEFSRYVEVVMTCLEVGLHLWCLEHFSNSL
jgi:hypothetical protein